MVSTTTFHPRLPMILLVFVILHRGLTLDIIGKPASQSSTYADWTADRAVDGDTATTAHTRVCSGYEWWMVDLEGIYCLTQITIVNRGDCCGDRLTGAIVRAGVNSDQSQNTQIGDPVTSTQATDRAVIDFLANPTVSARYVSVESYGDCLQLAEVMVTTETTSSTIDITGKPVSQSSTYLDWSANRAVDGDPDTVSHTECPSVQWWKIDLQEIYSLTKITLVNRRGCCWERLEGAIVRAGMNSDQSRNTQIGDPVTSAQATNGAVIDFLANPTVSARYVSVEMHGSKCLQLAEVMVASDTTGSTINLNGKPVSQSSTYVDSSMEWSADRAIDGDLDTVSHTECPSVQWWKVDLQAIYCLTKITIVSWRNCCGERLEGAIVRAGVNSDQSQNLQIGDPVTSTQATDGAVIDFMANLTVSARYISVEVHGSKCLLLAEVMVATKANICSTTQRAVHSTNVTVTWSPLPCADHYDVEYALSHKDGCEQINSLMYHQHCTCRESQTTINGLIPNSQYVVQIKAYVNGAYGPPATTQITTTSAAPTGPPTLVTTESIGQRNLTFTWSSPSCGDRGGTLTEYVYELSSPNTGWKTSAPISAEEVTINELLPFTNYSFRVIAKNSVGNSPFSEAVTARTLEAEPTVPLNVHIQSVDNVSVILRWSEPNPPRGVITHYNVRYWKSAQTDTMETTADVMGLMHRVAGLEASSNYLFQVQATTSAGAGPWSEAINTTTAIGVPGPIRNLTYTERTETSITLSWNPPLEPRGPILGYIVRIRAYVEYRILESPQPHLPAENAYHSSEVQGSPFLQNNLNPGTKYEFRVVARNGMFQGTHDEVLVVYTKPLDPRTPPRPNLNRDETTDTTVTISLVALGSEKRIESHVIHVKRLGVLSVNKRDVLVPGSYEDPASGYITAKFLKNNLPEIFVVGDSKMYGGYWNAPLQRDAVYNIRMGSLTQVNEREVNVTYSEPLTVIVQPSEPAENQNAAIITAAVLGPISLVLTLTVVITCVIWRRRSLKSTTNDSLLPGTMEMNTVHPSGTQKMDIKWKNLIVEDVVLGKGNFGEVRAGGVRVKGEVTKAAIKTLKDGASDSAVKDFKEEMQTMANIKPHRNIVSLLGACYHEGILHVALEYLPNGNLRDYLRRNRPKQEQGKEQNTETSHLTSLNLLTFGADVATGMDHLSKTGIIHRDLAARNILLAEDLTAKVSDFGLSRGEDIYVQKSSTRIPVRWLAIESLTRRIYKSKSDVWSFGILLWEIATYGSTPYPGIESKSLAQRLLDGYRMPKPENCTDDIYNLMLECWQEIPSRRPTFKEINEVLEDMSAHSNEHIYMSPTIYENFIIKKEFDDN